MYVQISLLSVSLRYIFVVYFRSEHMHVNCTRLARSVIGNFHLKWTSVVAMRPNEKTFACYYSTMGV